MVPVSRTEIIRLAVTLLLLSFGNAALNRLAKGGSAASVHGNPKQRTCQSGQAEIEYNRRFSNGAKCTPMAYAFPKHCRKSEIKQGVLGRPGQRRIVTDCESWNTSDSDQGVES
jgi:hypothetical protein